MVTKIEESIIREIHKNPLGETIIFGISVIGSGILCGSFVNELTVDSTIQWKNTFKILPTYLIIGYLLIIYRYNKCLYRERLDVENFRDDDYLTAYIRKQLLPEYVAKQKEMIKNGESGEFTTLGDVLKKFENPSKKDGEDK